MQCRRSRRPGRSTKRTRGGPYARRGDRRTMVTPIYLLDSEKVTSSVRWSQRHVVSEELPLGLCPAHEVNDHQDEQDDVEAIATAKRWWLDNYTLAELQSWPPI